MSGTFCLWHGTELKEATEWQKEQCNVAGMQCEGCEFLKVEGESNDMTLQEFENAGKCNGCYFYREIEGRKECTFRWFEDDSEDWEISKNCDEING